METISLHKNVKTQSIYWRNFGILGSKPFDKDYLGILVLPIVLMKNLLRSACCFNSTVFFFSYLLLFANLMHTLGFNRHYFQGDEVYA